jgi:squalene-associated FAD-dependent desaturase
MAGVVHVIGAGLAGLAAAIRLRAAGREVRVYEAAAQAGGRCRSYHDKELDCLIDNGNHLVLTGNTHIAAYVQAIDAADTFDVSHEAAFAFCDLARDERWTVRLNRGPIPWWLLSPSRRIPRTRLTDFIPALKLDRTDGATVKRVLPSNTEAWRRFWQPLTVAALNTEPEMASAALLWPVLRETFLKGGDACRAVLPKQGLSESLVNPALSRLDMRYGWRLRGLDITDARVAALDFTQERVALAPGDRVILAVTAPVAGELLPDLMVPDKHRAIVNAHYKVSVRDQPRFLGVIGGLAEWVFQKHEVVSVTISAADWCVDRPAEELARELWADVRRALALNDTDLPPWRILKEKRATFAATPEQDARRPGPAGPIRNLWLAGDWTQTGLPATIEGAVRSGHRAAELVLAAPISP